MPEVAVIDVSDWLIQNTAELCFDTAGLWAKCNSGLQLGSRFPCDPLEDVIFDYLPKSMFTKVRNVPDSARVLVLDKWTANSDGRQAVFSKRVKQRRDFGARELAPDVVLVTYLSKRGKEVAGD
jgi:hypothetical protein